MNPLPLILYPNSILRKKAEKVSSCTAELRALISHMVKAMEKNDGIGLAGSQVGRTEQIFVAQDGEKAHGFFNPSFVSKSKERSTEEEGCLSLPGIFLPVKRAERVVVACQTPKGEWVRVEAEGLVARIFQHEMDHLKGVLIIDRAGLWQRLKVRAKLKELERTAL
ncbi:peptide deformylase [Patescibacteria group bacterium]|nr:peptide deformylase [Patescibacteria group bacterium]